MYHVKWKRQGEWRTLFSTDNPVAAQHFAAERIVHGGITERIEIHDPEGYVETVYDAAWRETPPEPAYTRENEL